MTDTHAMVVRRDAAQATLDQFKLKPFRLGTVDCVRMVAAHLRRLGYKVKLPPSNSYRTEKMGLKLLKQRGFSTLADAIDAHGLQRIPPAAVVVGDVVEMPTASDMGALAVVLGNGRIITFHDDAPGAVVAQAIEIKTAWRAQPR